MATVKNMAKVTKLKAGQKFTIREAAVVSGQIPKLAASSINIEEQVKPTNTIDFPQTPVPEGPVVDMPTNEPVATQDPNYIQGKMDGQHKVDPTPIELDSGIAEQAKPTVNDLDLDAAKAAAVELKNGAQQTSVVEPVGIENNLNTASEQEITFGVPSQPQNSPVDMLKPEEVSTEAPKQVDDPFASFAPQEPVKQDMPDFAQGVTSEIDSSPLNQVEQPMNLNPDPVVETPTVDQSNTLDNLVGQEIAPDVSGFGEIKAEEPIVEETKEEEAIEMQNHDDNASKVESTNNNVVNFNEYISKAETGLGSVINDLIEPCIIRIDQIEKELNAIKTTNNVQTPGELAKLLEENEILRNKIHSLEQETAALRAELEIKEKAVEKAMKEKEAAEISKETAEQALIDRTAKYKEAYEEIKEGINNVSSKEQPAPDILKNENNGQDQSKQRVMTPNTGSNKYSANRTDNDMNQTPIEGQPQMSPFANAS